VTETLPRRPTAVILRAAEAEAWSDGFAFLDEARRRGEARLAETETVVEAARAEGFEAGRRDGEQAAAELLLRTAADVDRHVAGLEAQLSDLALAVVRKVVGNAFGDAELVAACAREALGAFRDEARVVLRVAPHLADEVRRRLAEVGAAAAVIVEPTAGMGEGRCSIASSAKTMEIGLEAQLAALRAAMTGTGETA
jgi:type III secretion protein L